MSEGAAAAAGMAEAEAMESSAQAGLGIARKKSTPYGWKQQQDASGEDYWVSNVGEIVYDAPDLPTYALPSSEKGQVCEWSRFFDSTDREYYYANTFSGETTEEKPALFDKFAKKNLPPPPFQSAALSIQLMLRQRRARFRVLAARGQRHVKFAGSHARWVRTHHPKLGLDYWYNPTTKAIRWDQPRGGEEYDFGTEPGSKYPAWYRIWDTVTKQHYYFHTADGTWQFAKPPEWNAVLWLMQQAAGFPPLLRAAMTLQVTYRKRQLRRRVQKDHEMRERMGAEERAEYVRARALKLAHERQEMQVRREIARERDELAALAHEEALQRGRGDRFWGVDAREQAKQHRLELEAELERQRRRKLEEEEQQKRAAQERRARIFSNRMSEAERESAEMAALHDQESEQRSRGDSFWGRDKEETDRQHALSRMREEDQHSRLRGMRDHLEALHVAWKQDLDRSEADMLRVKMHRDLKSRSEYMGHFFRSVSSDQVITYQWPAGASLSASGPVAAAARSHREQDILERTWSHAGGFNMNEVFDQRRLDAPASQFHALNPLKSAPPIAARDFVVRPNPADGFALLPHLHKLDVQALSEGAVPPEMVQRQIDSRQRGASRSLQSPSFREARRLRASAGTLDAGLAGLEMRSDLLPRIDPGASDADVRGVIGGASGRKARRKARRKKRRVRRRKPRDLWTKGRSRSSRQEGSKDQIDAGGQKGAQPPPPPPPPPPVSIVVEFSDAQVKTLRTIFELIDADNSGLVDQHEMMVALRANDRVIHFVQTSRLLRPLLMDHDFAATFMAMDPNSDGGISFDEFLNFMQENSREEDVVADMEAYEAEQRSREGPARPETMAAVRGPQQAVTALGQTLSSSDKAVTQGENALLRRIFRLMSGKGADGTVSKRELLFALKSIADVRDYVEQSPSLAQLFRDPVFLDVYPESADEVSFVTLSMEHLGRLKQADAPRRKGKPAAEGPTDAAEQSATDRLDAEIREELRTAVGGIFGEVSSLKKSRVARMMLKPDKVSLLTSVSSRLEELVRPRTFRKTLTQLDTDSDDSITVSEMVEFCAAQIVAGLARK